MPPTSLPDHADIATLTTNATVLRDLVRAGAAGAIDLVRDITCAVPGWKPARRQRARSRWPTHD